MLGMKASDLVHGYVYTFIFLPCIKSHAVEAIMSYANDKGVDPKDAITQLRNLGGKTRTIARLMDEYYYVITR